MPDCECRFFGNLDWLAQSKAAHQVRNNASFSPVSAANRLGGAHSCNRCAAILQERFLECRTSQRSEGSACVTNIGFFVSVTKVPTMLRSTHDDQGAHRPSQPCLFKNVDRTHHICRKSFSRLAVRKLPVRTRCAMQHNLRLEFGKCVCQ